ncbi:hypothetical protein GCM10008938_48660 [Deinococcus roseus]|uniref:Uncharacterized protein n=2 Tax=Deinococcus roseus TaxID=392414 RepID=A0ABQ2DGG7_9DEIO|nr:hypothetical protein GCM10008938_48660 [Deinococcus roseus]
MTLLQVLVTIAIIGIIARIGAVGYSQSTKRIASQAQAEQFRTMIRDAATMATSRSLPLTLTVASGVATLKNGTTVMRTLTVDKITTGLGTSQSINFDTTGRVSFSSAASSLSMKVNSKDKTLLVSGIGQTRWQ